MIACWSVGCLCGLSPDHAVLNKWCHGRAFIEVERGGFFHVDNRKIIDGVLR